MNDAIVRNWNKMVGKSDIVYHLGDFGDVSVRERLNGLIYLLRGNYDTDREIGELSKCCEIIPSESEVVVEGNKLLLVHKPLDATRRDRLYLFGHIHKLQMVKQNGLNVGVDCHDFGPIDSETVAFYFEAMKNEYDENVYTRHMGLLS